MCVPKKNWVSQEIGKWRFAGRTTLSEHRLFRNMSCLYRSLRLRLRRRAWQCARRITFFRLSRSIS